jgi:hypothetical protein
MPAGQRLLFASAKPLVKRLGKEFFRKLPARPGVYLMRNAAGEVVYVGKAKNLRERLRSYRVANPEHMPRRHLRMVSEVVRIDVEVCHNESAALDREARMILKLKPKFNRAGVWQGKARFLTWRITERAVQLSVDEVPPPGWERFGSLGAYAPRLHGALVRSLWLALNPQVGYAQLPYGWTRNRFALPVTVACGTRIGEIRQALESLFWGKPEAFTAWMQSALGADLAVFDRAAVQADLEEIDSFAASYRDAASGTSRQQALL